MTRRRRIVIGTGAVALLLFVALGLAGGCSSTTVPRKLTKAQREQVDATHIRATVGVEKHQLPVYSQKLLSALRATNLFDQVEHLDDLAEPPDLIASVARGVYGTGVIPLWTGLTLGIVPTTVEEEHGHVFHLYAGRMPAESVLVSFTYRGPTTLGWVGVLLNASPTRAGGEVRESRQFYDALAYQVVLKTQDIQALLQGPEQPRD